MTLAAVKDFLRNQQLRNICIDSRNIQPGDIFVALSGNLTDGRQFIQQAIANGAAALLIEESTIASAQQTKYAVPTFYITNLKVHLAELASFYYANPSEKLKVIGITGTNGKTSTSHYIAQLLTAVKSTCGVMGTLGSGIYPTLQSSALTTSDCCEMQRRFNEFVLAQASYVAMEVSSIGLDQGRLNNTKINTAVFTNLSQDHLDYHKDMEDYFVAKCKLFTEFAPQYCVINIDDVYGQRLLSMIPPNSQVITYSLLNPKADLYYVDHMLHTPWGVGELKTKLIGKFNLSNLLAAISSCGLQGIALTDLLNAAQNLTAVAGRMQAVTTNTTNAPQVIVDYAHTPDALIKVLQTLRETKPKKLYCVFGCGGDRDPKKRPLMLRAVLDNSDEVIITQDNSRTEDPQQIIQHMLDGNVIAANVEIELDRAKAIQKAVARAKYGEVILIAGKGHEDYQIVGTTKYPFSDVLVAQQALLNY